VEILVTEGEQNGSLGPERAEMIRNVLDFGDLRARDVMVPRTQVSAIDAAMPTEEILRFVAERAHSRYPVYRERIDNVVGILHVKDLVARAALGDIRSVQVSELMRTPVVFVPETQSASSVLKDMRSGRHHMAIIIDEFGGMSGIATLEDVIEEIVGDIRDEHDDEEPPIVDLGDGRLMVDAGVPIGDLSRYLGVELPEDGGYSSLGGFLIERVGQVPPVGHVLSEQGLDFVVRDADERRVVKVEIVRQTPLPGPGGPESLPPVSPHTRRPAA
jgi:CBS domain containing-hemolysin-like protein